MHRNHPRHNDQRPAASDRQETDSAQASLAQHTRDPSSKFDGNPYKSLLIAANGQDPHHMQIRSDIRPPRAQKRTKT